MLIPKTKYCQKNGQAILSQNHLRYLSINRDGFAPQTSSHCLVTYPIRRFTSDAKQISYPHRMVTIPAHTGRLQPLKPSLTKIEFVKRSVPVDRIVCLIGYPLLSSERVMRYLSLSLRRFFIVTRTIKTSREASQAKA
jgi:hypothetical protein